MSGEFDVGIFFPVIPNADHLHNVVVPKSQMNPVLARKITNITTIIKPELYQVRHMH